MLVVDEDFESVMHFFSESLVGTLSILNDLRLGVAQVILNFHSSKVLLRLGERSLDETGAGDRPTGCFGIAFRSTNYGLVFLHEQLFFLLENHREELLSSVFIELEPHVDDLLHDSGLDELRSRSME